MLIEILLAASLCAVPMDSVDGPVLMLHDEFGSLTLVRSHEVVMAVPEDSTEPFGPDDIEPVPWGCLKCHRPVPEKPKPKKPKGE